MENLIVEEENRKEKSRNLRIFEYFKILQLEALCAELRGKIYTRSKDRNYWRKVYEHKKKTVQDIAERNKVDGQPLPNIFSDEEIYRDYSNEIYGNGGFPTFLYKNQENEYLQGPYDSQYYYSRGADVSCKHLGEVKIGVVAHYQGGKEVSVEFPTGEIVEFNITAVTRIL